MERAAFADALVAATTLLSEAPTERDVLYMIAVCQRYLGQGSDALATLAQLEQWHPRFSRLFQERGHCHVARRAVPEAIDAFERAVSLNPALPASWNALQVLYRAAGRSAESATAAAHVVKLGSLPAAIIAATGMYADGDVAEAERLVRHFLLTHGDHIEGMRLLAKIGVDLDVLDDAELLLERLLELAPDYHAARFEYASVLLKRHKHLQARGAVEALLRRNPTDRTYRNLAAAIEVGFGDVDRAQSMYQELLLESPTDAALHMSLAHTLKTLGRTPAAIESYRAATAYRPSYGEAYWSLANLKTYRFTDAELGQMRREQQAPNIDPVDRYHLCFALGKALEDRGEYAESFEFYARGNDLKRIECRYRPQIIETNARLQEAVCTREFLAARQGLGCDSNAPIFIVGLPRSGSTLLEQILASHSQVEGTMELADIPRLVQHLQGRAHDDANPPFPGVLAALPAEKFRQFGEAYLSDTRAYRQLGQTILH